MAHKAKLGFKYIALEDEMILPDEEDIEEWQENRRLSAKDKIRLTKLRCYHKNKEQYNKVKRVSETKVEKRYRAAKRYAVYRNQPWDFTLEEWEQAWMEAARVRIPGSQSAAEPEGRVVPAYALRGQNRHNSTCMQRLDLDRPWGPDNYCIMYRGEVHEPGSKWYVPWDQDDQ